MVFNSQAKIILIVVAVFVLVFFLYDRNNEGFSENPDVNNNLPENISNEEIRMAEAKEDVPMDNGAKYIVPNDYAPPETDWLNKKFNGRNKARTCEYKRSSYSASKRGNLGPADWDDFFDHNNNIIAPGQKGDNDKFIPIDETGGGYAAFKTKGRATCGSNQDCDPADLFDVDKVLPKEVNDDWFEVIQEPVSVNNRNLIQITHPISVDTIGQSKKNASHDIRGTPASPKFVVSPWLHLARIRDTNIKPLY